MLTKEEKGELLKKVADAIDSNKPIGEIKVLLCALVGAGVNISASFRYYEDINILGIEYEYTLLHLAVDSGNVNVIKELLAYGADTRAKLNPINESITEKAIYGQTALDIAIEKVVGKKGAEKYSEAPSDYNIIKLISDHDKSKRNKHIVCASIATIVCISAIIVPSTLWITACVCAACLICLGMCGYQAYQYQQNLNQITPEIRTELKKINVEQRYSNKTVLHKYSEGAGITASKRTLFLLAAEYGHLDIVKYLMDKEVLY